MTRFKQISGKSRHVNGWKRDRPDHRDKMLKTSFWRAVQLPKTAVIPLESTLVVEDQGDVGSCTCNSSTSGTEYALKNEGVTVQLSRLYAYAKVREAEGTPLSEDSGAQIRDVMKVLAAYGCPPESDWPYDLTKWQVDPPASLNAEAGKYRLTFYFRCPSLLTIMDSISQGFPVAGGFTCFESMFTKEVEATGIIPMPTPNEGTEGGHAVLFTGYDSVKRQFRFLNSWGTQWGDKGYGYLPFGYVEQGLAADFWTQRRAGDVKC